ncbi:hypothetical protein CTEN210_12551 [Chaetoceros tenuissimus]|uniref:GPI inositol-deacylase n=1 Tax=Chaetoceros tenuissimus TaxID=426638 RepID=A0AAD3HA66_9STRA|nr:hypothetical protein CTEN210_12551 [Chaetoceros tenuissimus]
MLTRSMIHRILFFLPYVSILKSAQCFCPIVICPGFGNCSKDYETPFDKDEELGLVSVLGRRGFDTEKIYTVPIQRLDWMNVARGLFDFRFYSGDAKADGLGYGWYLKRLRETVELAHEESGGEKVLLLAHSAGSWLARAALGGVHRVPHDASSCVTRGALKNTDTLFPGAFLAKEGLQYFSIGGAAVKGSIDTDCNAQNVAFHGYKLVSGTGNMIGDGIVPLEWTKLEGAKHISLEGVFHSICNIEAKKSAEIHELNHKWYGSENVVDRWLPEIMKDLELGTSKIESMDETTLTFC